MRAEASLTWGHIGKMGKQMGSNFLKLGSGLGGWMAVGGIGASALTSVSESVLTLGKESIQAAADYEKLANAFSTYIQGSGALDEFISHLRDYQAASTLGMDETNQAAQSLLRYGLTGENTIDTLKRLDGIATVTGKSISGLAEAYGRVMVQGVNSRTAKMWLSASGKDMASAFAERDSITREQAERKLKNGGYTKQDFASLVEADEATKNFEKNAKTFASTLGELENRFKELRESVGKELLGELTHKLPIATKAIQDFKPMAAQMTRDIISIAKSGTQFAKKLLDGPFRFLIQDRLGIVDMDKLGDQFDAENLTNLADEVAGLMKRAENVKSTKEADDLEIDVRKKLEDMMEAIRNGTSVAQYNAREQMSNAHEALQTLALRRFEIAEIEKKKARYAREAEEEEEEKRKIVAARDEKNKEIAKRTTERKQIKKEQRLEETLEIQAGMDINERLKDIRTRAAIMGIDPDNIPAGIEHQRDMLARSGEDTWALESFAKMYDAYVSAQKQFEKLADENTRANRIREAYQVSDVEGKLLEAQFAAQDRLKELIAAGYGTPDAQKQVAGELAPQIAELMKRRGEEQSSHYEKPEFAGDDRARYGGGGRLIAIRDSASEQTAKTVEEQLNETKDLHRATKEILDYLRGQEKGISLTP